MAPASVLEAERWQFPKHSVIVEKEREKARCTFSAFQLLVDPDFLAVPLWDFKQCCCSPGLSPP